MRNRDGIRTTSDLSESNIVALSSCLPAGGQAPHQPLHSVLQLRTQTPLLAPLLLHSVRYFN